MATARPIIVVLGPTAGGKTRCAIELAHTLPGGGECISADSMVVYRGMDIGTAKPTANEQAEVTHHLIDLVRPSEEGFTVDRWLDLAEQVISDVRSRERWPIVVGGTNLYVKALLEGLFDGPQPDPQIRAHLESLEDTKLRRFLEACDPAAAERIHPNDRRRTIRAIEVHETTGTPISELQQQWDTGRIRKDCIIVGLDYPAEVINRRINERVREMFNTGLVEETRNLLATTKLGRQARVALGYAQVLEHLAGKLSLDETIEQVKIKTRRYAKQQRTWLRRFRAYRPAWWFSIDQADASIDITRLVDWIVAEAGNAVPDGPPDATGADPRDRQTPP